jgi:hypothetical protein
MMLAAYLATVKAYFNQVRVVHHLPGRLRIHIPLLERLSPGWQRYKPDLIEIIKRKPGFVDIDFSIITGRVLIRYEPHQITQTQILQWFRRVALMLCEGYADAPFHSQRQIAPFLKRMRAQSRLWL